MLFGYETDAFVQLLRENDHFVLSYLDSADVQAYRVYNDMFV